VGRADLVEVIEEIGSITATAEHFSMSYMPWDTSAISRRPRGFGSSSGNARVGA